MTHKLAHGTRGPSPAPEAVLGAYSAAMSRECEVKQPSRLVVSVRQEVAKTDSHQPGERALATEENARDSILTER